MPSAAFLRTLDAVRRRAAEVDAQIQRDVATTRVPGLPTIDPFLAAVIIGAILARAKPDEATRLRALPLRSWVPMIRRELEQYAEQARTPAGAPVPAPSTTAPPPITQTPFPQLPGAPSTTGTPTVPPPQTPGPITPRPDPAIPPPVPDYPQTPTDAPANRPDGTTGEKQTLPAVESRDMRTEPPPTPARLPEPEPSPQGPGGKVGKPPPESPPTQGGAIIPLPPPGLPEPLREAWIQARTRAGDYCRGLGDVIRSWPNDVEREAWSGENIAEEVNEELRRQKREIIRVATAEAIAKTWTPERLASELGHKTGEWSRNWLRIARTELQGANNEGVAIESLRAYGADARVARVPETGACQSCLDAYTKDGRPIVFTVNELLANGTNVGRKREDWRPTLWPQHPLCRCATMSIPPGTTITHDGTIVKA